MMKSSARRTSHHAPCSKIEPSKAGLVHENKAKYKVSITKLWKNNVGPGIIYHARKTILTHDLEDFLGQA